MMLAAERLAAISDRLSTLRRVQADELAREFQVSEDTIRRDLRELAAQGHCQRVYGGALATSSVPSRVQDRRGEAVGRKQALGRAAAACLKRGQFVFLDSGSTNLALAQHIPPGLELTIATHDVSIAAALASRDDMELIVIGGKVDPRTGSAMGAQVLSAVQRLRPDVLVLGLCAIDAATGVTSFQHEDAVLKSVLVENAGQVVAAALNEKLSAAAPFHVGSADVISTLVTEATVTDQQIASLQAAGITITKASSS